MRHAGGHISNVSSLPEVVGDAALLVDPRDEAALGEAIHRGLTDAALRAQMKARGLERAKLFSWKRCTRETWAVYEEAIRNQINAEAPSSVRPLAQDANKGRSTDPPFD